jgi:hypothetical protein
MTTEPNTFVLEGNMYNLVHGTNHYAPFLMGVLGIHPSSAGRFRDCFMQRASDGALEICIYTRNGGGNRAAYADATQQLREHPLYLRDFDAALDNTYAEYIFRLPNGDVGERLQEMAERDPERALPKSHAERMQEFTELMQREPVHPDVKRVMQAMRPIFEGEGVTILKDRG